MFGLGKKGKVTSSIGKALHQQIYSAMTENEQLTNERLLSLFTNGYISTFVLCVYSFEELNAEKMFNNNFRKILDGVLPNKLYEIFLRQNEMRQLADTMEESKPPEMVTGNQNPKYFEEAKLLAKEDAKSFVNTGDMDSANSWYNYLTGKDNYSQL